MRSTTESQFIVEQSLDHWRQQALDISGLCAVVGNLLGSNTSNLFVILAQAVSGGAMLAMLASTMMPEAYKLGGGSVAFSTIVGFLTGFFVSSPHL